MIYNFITKQKMPDKRKDSLNNEKSKKLKTSDQNSEQITFDPVHFIRSHSKNNDPADIQTQVRFL